jgi:hypothetical protein
MNVSDVKKLQALDDEKNRPKRKLTDAIFENAALKGSRDKNVA